MRLNWIICSVSLLVTFSSSTSLKCQQLHSENDLGRPSACGASSRERNRSESVATAIPASPLADPHTPGLPGKVSDQPQSIFDALETGMAGPITTIEVQAVERELEISEPFRAGGQEVLSSAGAFGDVSRFLQVLPGVVATSDLSNAFLVRGGHPMENLFVVDGIEIPNINHLAMSGSTGGFGPMIDAALIQGLKFYTGGYDGRYPERLSSVVEIQTLDRKDVTTHLEGDVGIQGVGGLFEKQIHGGDLLGSAHYGLLNLMDNAGITGLPSYANELMRFRRAAASGNRLTVLHLGGRDSVDFSLCPMDPFSFSTIDSQYSGWRETTGLEWQRIYSAHSFGVTSISDSEEIENIHQQDQSPDPQHLPQYDGLCPTPRPDTPPVPVYLQDSNEAFSNAGYRFEWSGPRYVVTAGSAFWLQRPHYRIEQPIGSLSPYSAAPVRTDSTSFVSNFSTGESGTFAQITAHPFSKFTLTAGGRFQTFALGNHTTLTPHLSLRYSPNERVAVHLAFASYAQMPPYVYLLSYPQNRSMLPMRATHEIIGLDLSPGFASQIHLEAYNKAYSNIPVSTEYRAINIHNVVEMIGQQIVRLPMESGGRGQSSGIEISDLTRIGSRTVIRASVAYSRAMFTGLDGIRRPSNYGLPWIVNFAALQRLGHGYEVSSRYGYATGRPYTPFDLADSFAQNRPIYDVS